MFFKDERPNLTPKQNYSIILNILTFRLLDRRQEFKDTELSVGRRCLSYTSKCLLAISSSFVKSVFKLLPFRFMTRHVIMVQHYNEEIFVECPRRK
jgi:hypothetical protein